MTLLCLCVKAQNLRVTGVVRDKSDVIIGASVMVKNSTVGTVTDMDGRYSVEVPANGVLIFSYIGYTPVEKQVDGQTVINVTMNDDVQAIDEVVVTAIGIKQQKKKLGYTTQQVNTEALDQPGTVNVGNALSGQVAGLTVNNPTGIFQAPSFSLRGKTPLMVIDGVPVESDLFDVSPENIESINVLKGTAAAALYGSRGKDGAILITTKLAKEDGLTVTAGLSSMVSAGFTVFPETQTEFGSGSNGQYAFWDGADGGISDGDMTWGPRFAGQKIAQWNSPIRNKETGETIPWWGDVSGTIYDDQSKYERVPIAWEPHDNLRDFLRTGIITKATFSVASKSKKANYNFNGDFSNQRGQVPNTSVYTGGLNFNSMYNLSNSVTLSANLSYNKVYSPNYPRYGYGPKNHMYTILLWMGNDVNGKELAEHYYRPDSEGTRQANYNYAWYNNPYFAANELTQKHDRNTMNGQLKLNWDVIPGLSLQGRAAGRLESTFEDMSVPKSYMNYGDSRNGDYKTWNTDQLDINADFLATYTRAFSRNFTLTVNAGTSLYYRQIRKQSQSTDGLIVAKVYNLGNSLNPVSATNSMNEKAIESVYGSVNVDLFESLFLTFTGRNDWSSALVYANKNGNYSYFYPSVSGSWLISETFKDKMPSWISFAKIRGSWAQVGNDTGAYTINSGYNVGNLQLIDGSYVYTNSFSSTAISPNLKPERKNAWEVGLDLRFLDNRINLDATYYKENTRDQIMNISTPSISGVSNQLINAGNIQNSGVEIALNTIPFRNKDWEWNLDFTFTKNNNKIIELHPDAAEYIGLRGSTGWGNMRIQSAARVGGPYGVLISDITPKRDDNGNIILKWSDSDRSAYADRSLKNEVIGDMNPDFLGSVSTGLTWKNLSFRMALDMRFGGKVAVYGNRYGTAYGWTESSLKFRDEAHGGMTWTSQYLNADGSQSGSYGVTYHDGMIPQGIFASGTQVTGIDGKTHDVGGMSYQQAYENGILEPMHAASYYNYANQWATGVTNDGWIHDLKYIALREITVGYTFPSNIAGKIGAKRLGVSFSARNLGYLYNSLPNDVNPEGVRGNLSGEFRIRSFDPYTANYTMTINVGF